MKLTNAKAEYNVLLAAHLFSTAKKGKGGENYQPQIYSDVASAGKKEDFLS